MHIEPGNYAECIKAKLTIQKWYDARKASRKALINLSLLKALKIYFQILFEKINC